MISKILLFSLGLIIGSLLGMSLLCLCIVSKDEEDT